MNEKKKALTIRALENADLEQVVGGSEVGGGEGILQMGNDSYGNNDWGGGYENAGWEGNDGGWGNDSGWI